MKIGRVIAINVDNVVLDHSEKCPIEVLERVFDATTFPKKIL